MLRVLIYLVPVAVFVYLWWSRRSSSAGDVKSMLARGARILDVRTRAEFSSGSHPKAINIPLDQLAARIGELDRAKPLLVCCESGARSAIAVSILKKAGFDDVANLGSWRRIQGLLA
jgi:rhodanese-related sulfurtransferase